MDKEIQMVDILCFTETHFEVTDVISAKTFWRKKKGEVYRNDRVGRKGGGVAIVVSEKFISNQIAIDSQLEVAGVEVYCPNKVVVLCTYIPPGVSKVAAKYHIQKLIGNVLHETDRVIVLGDFNEDILFDQDGKLIHGLLAQLLIMGVYWIMFTLGGLVMLVSMLLTLTSLIMIGCFAFLSSEVL